MPNGARCFPLDVREPEQWERMLGAFAQAAGGRLNVLANNAGVPLGGPLAELTTNEIDRTLAQGAERVRQRLVATHRLSAP